MCLESCKGGAFSSLTLRPLNSFANHSFLEGIIIGGNLTTVASGIGTFWQIRPKNKIIFLEEVDERGYKLDRMLTHLKQAHIFEEAKAIILGDFIGGREKDGSTYVDKVINEFIDQMRLPVYHLPHAGHGDENFPFPLNMPVKLRVLMDGK